MWREPDPRLSRGGEAPNPPGGKLWAFLNRASQAVGLGRKYTADDLMRMYGQWKQVNPDNAARTPKDFQRDVMSYGTNRFYAKEDGLAYSKSPRVWEEFFNRLAVEGDISGGSKK